MKPEATQDIPPDKRASSTTSIQGKEREDDLDIPTWRLVILSFCLCFGLFLSLVDTSIVATALFTIGADFDSLSQVTWIALAYTLTYLGCAVIFASVGNVIGRRNAYVAAFVIFTAFSVGAGFAQSLQGLIAMRAIQGLGGSGLYSLTMIIFVEIYPIRKMKHISGLIGAVMAIGGVLGPVLGGIITHLTTWRWIFWMNGPVGVFALVLFWISWPPANQMRPLQLQKFTQLDLVGSVLLIAASVLFVFAFQQGGLTSGAWGSTLVIAPLVIGCLCWGLLFGWEALVSRYWSTSIDAIFPTRLLTNRIFMGGVISTLLVGFEFFLIIFSLPLRFQVVNQKSSLLAGLGLLPMLGSGAVGSFLAGAFNAKRNNTFYTFFVGVCLSLVGAGLLSTLAPTEVVEAKTYGYEVFAGLGFGLSVASASIMTALETDLRDAAVAQGIVAQARVLGGSIGIAATSAILGATESRELAGIVSLGQLSALQSAAGSLTPEQLQAVRQAYSDSFGESMHVCAAIMGLGVLTVLMTFQRHPLSISERRKQQMQKEAERVDFATPSLGAIA